MMTPADLETTRRSTLFSGLQKSLQDTLLETAELRICGPEDPIFLQGDTPDALFVLLEGWIQLYRVAATGTEAVVGVLGAGRSFGELSALHDVPYPVTARAITSARLLRMEAPTLRRLMETEPSLGKTMLAAAFVHMEQLVLQIEDLTTRSGFQRLAFFLLGLADKYDDPGEVALPYSKALVAGQLGMKPETLSRAFARLRGHGVRIQATSIFVDDWERLHWLVAAEPMDF